ncbi:MAG TPA: Dam family site-specific DNA-(adenine-N6)-methyltransferase, partial [Sedimentisphaerales bacterium]|nr:Dam family site-specific DNA-(adenine-N6)-methyltransferase [Sedimentisphaerales bacterium]
DMPLADYFAFTLAWLAELKRVVRPTGSIWLHGTYHNIGIINFALQLLQVEIINEVVWYKRNSFPNLSGRRLTASHETILWAHTGGPKKRQYHFDYDTAKQMAFPEDSLKELGKQMRTVWDIPNNKRPDELQFGKHPTQKPLRLLTRMLQISGTPGGVVLVPFAGAGSDCVAARKLGMRYIAFETDPEYVAICKKRLAGTDSLSLLELRSVETPAVLPPVQDQPLHTARQVKTVPSLIKWTGSKRSQTRDIAGYMPAYRRYIEPFLGGGAVLFAAAVPGSLAADVYEPLVRLWQLLRDDPFAVVDDYSRKWHQLSEELAAIDRVRGNPNGTLPAIYYDTRARFNKTKDPLDLNFLMRTCVNGIVRFNDAGEFNNSFHLSRPGMDPAGFRSVVEAWHPVIQGVDFVCQDYSLTLSQATEGDFVYLDPPYAGNYQRYTQDLDMDRFFIALEDLNSRNVQWALSFDGRRGAKDLVHPVPTSLYRRHVLLTSGNSPVSKVLNGPIEPVKESLYLNY